MVGLEASMSGPPRFPPLHPRTPQALRAALYSQALPRARLCVIVEAIVVAMLADRPPIEVRPPKMSNWRPRATAHKSRLRVSYRSARIHAPQGLYMYATSP